MLWTAVRDEDQNKYGDDDDEYDDDDDGDDDEIDDNEDCGDGASDRNDKMDETQVGAQRGDLLDLRRGWQTGT